MILANRGRSWTRFVVGATLFFGAVAHAEPTHSWEAGAPNNGDITTFPSGIRISATDLLSGIVPLRNNDLAAGYPNNTNGYIPVDNSSGDGLCNASPLDRPLPDDTGFYPHAAIDTSGAGLTDGEIGVDLDSVLADFRLPSAVFQFDLPAPADLGEIRVFVQNTNSPGNGRVFQNYDVYISRDANPDAKERRFVKLIDRVISSNIVCGPDGMNPNGNDTQAHNFPDGAIGATLTRVFDDGSPRLASGVTSIRFVFWPVSNTGGAFWDQWLGVVDCGVGIDPLDVDPEDTDGFKRAFEASIVREIDVLPPQAAVETCDNDVDDDGDKAADCADPDCTREPVCGATVEFCWNVDENGEPVDDDGDGLANRDDPDCAPTPWPCPPENCANDADDDGNTLADCADPDCWADPVCGFVEICDNGLDDDDDERIDCGDPDCENTEACACTHDPVFDVDDDGDVDQTDFGVWQLCLTGPDPDALDFFSLPVDCQCMDVSSEAGLPDQAISQDDFRIFKRCATGPALPMRLDQNCDDPPFE